MPIQNVSGQPGTPGAPNDPVDDATRHLAAAVHVDEAFADEIIEEYLTEPRRAIPPSPGVDPVVVLTEAIASRRRRVLRDVLALALLVAIMIAGWPFSLVWLVAAAAGAMAQAISRNSRRLRGQASASANSWVAVMITAAIGGVVAWFAITSIFSRQQSSDYSAEAVRTSGGGAVGVVLAVVFGIALLAVMTVDRSRVYGLLRDRFQRPAWLRRQGWTKGYPVPWPPAASAWYTPRLKLIARSMGQTNTHVHYGYNAFVGAGRLAHVWSMVIRLRPAAETATVEPITPAAVYQAVIDEVLAMRDSDSLAPGQRLTTLRHSQELITSANALLYYNEDPISAAILPDLTAPPQNFIDPTLIESVIDKSPEWVRPYLVFQIEGWDRELVLSTYLHVGCDENTLYLEWAAGQLNAIKQDYRVERMELTHPPMALWRSLLDAATLPVSVPVRLRTLWRAIRDANGTPGTDIFDPGKSYGARRSMREIAAEDDSTTYFEAVDGVRYLKLLERQTLAAVDHALRAHGLSTEEFAEQTNTVVQSTVINGGSFTGVNIVGQGNQTKTGQVSAGATQQPGPTSTTD